MPEVIATLGEWKRALQIDAAALALTPHDLNAWPTRGQRHAGNYQKGHFRWHGLDISIETAKGGTRTAKDGAWTRQLTLPYGYIRRTTGTDGDQVDCFLGPYLNSPTVFVINQTAQDGTLDEHKCMIGFLDLEAAVRGYRSNYPVDWQGLDSVRAMGVAAFKDWLRHGDLTVHAENPNHDERGRFTSGAGSAKAAFASQLQGWLAGRTEEREIHEALATVYQSRAERVFDAMTPTALERFNANLRSVQFYRSSSQLTEALVQDMLNSGALPADLPTNYSVGGAYDQVDHTLHLDGGFDRESTDLVYAHEFSHVVDTGSRYSDHRDWREAWREEVNRVDAPLSQYARVNAAEGFAEFGRALYVAHQLGGGATDRLAEAFPLAMTFWRSRGLA